MDSLCRGIFAGDSRKLSVRSCFPILFQAERKFGSVLIGMVAGADAKDPRFTSRLIGQARQERWAQWSLKQGMQTLPEAMEQELRRRGVEIHLHSPVQALRQTAEGSWEVTLDGGTVKADHVCASVPAQVLSGMLPQSWDLLCGRLRQIGRVSVVVVNLEYQGSVLPVSGFGHLVPSRESGEILGVVYDSCSYPQQDRAGPQTTRLTVMLGGSWFREAFGDPDSVPHDHLLQRATETLRDHLGVTERPLRTIVKVHKECIPQYALGHWKHLDGISKFIDRLGLPLTLVGSSYQGVSVNDCIYQAQRSIEGLRD
uniref:protoporphyrinogen oxidase isoform X2 n=1 Tax=Pristiophorus japonicus TaxID=55135 RepID=UPI00398F10A2